MTNRNCSNSPFSSTTKHISIEQYSNSNSLLSDFYGHNIVFFMRDYIYDKEDLKLSDYKKTKLILDLSELLVKIKNQEVDLRTFNLQTLELFGNTQFSTCYGAFEACFPLIKLLTLINVKDKKNYLISNDISFIWRFIKEQQIIHLIDLGENKLDLLIQDMSENNQTCCQLLEAHKVTNFNFTTEK